MGDDLHPVLKLLSFLTWVTFGLFGLWCVVIAFVGGTTPIFGWEQDGSVGAGLLWLFVFEPILVMVGFWISLIVLVPLSALFRKR